MDISKLSKEEKAELLRKLKEEEKTESIQRKETYEALRHQFMVIDHFSKVVQF